MKNILLILIAGVTGYIVYSQFSASKPIETALNVSDGTFRTLPSGQVQIVRTGTWRNVVGDINNGEYSLTNKNGYFVANTEYDGLTRVFQTARE
jgi:hypothetical protein